MKFLVCLLLGLGAATAADDVAPGSDVTSQLTAEPDRADGDQAPDASHAVTYVQSHVTAHDGYGHGGYGHGGYGYGGYGGYGGGHDHGYHRHTYSTIYSYPGYGHHGGVYVTPVVSHAVVAPVYGGYGGYGGGYGGYGGYGGGYGYGGYGHAGYGY